jgi:hypothetical protein
MIAGMILLLMCSLVSDRAGQFGFWRFGIALSWER